MSEITKKEDRYINYTFTNNKVGIDITASDVNDITVHIYQKPKNILKTWKYSLGEVEIVNSSEGKYRIVLPETITENFVISKLLSEIEIDYIDTNFPDGIRTRRKTGLYISDIKDTAT